MKYLVYKMRELSVIVEADSEDEAIARSEDVPDDEWFDSGESYEAYEYEEG